MHRARDRSMAVALAATLVVALALPLPAAVAGVQAQGGDAPEGPFNIDLLAEVGEATHRAVEASRSVVYAISGGRLETRENTRTPSVLATTDIRGLDVYPYGDGVMVLRPDGFTWVDCSDPTSPTVLGEFTYSSDVTINGFFATSRYAYFSYAYGYGGGGTKIVDLSNPADLHYVAYTGLIFHDLHGDVRGDYAYVTTENGFKTIRLTSPTAPTVVNTYSGAAVVGDVVVAGDELYLGHGNPENLAQAKGLRVFALTSPAAPSLVGDLAMPAPLVDIGLNDTHAFYVDADETAGLIDVATPSAPATEPGTVDVVCPAERLAASGDFAHMITRDDADPVTVLLTVDAEIPTSPAITNDERRDGGYAGATLGDDVLFVGTHLGFEAYNVGDPANPVLISECTGAGFPATDIRTVVTPGGTIAYVAEGDQLETFSDALNTPVSESAWTSAGASVDRLALSDGDDTLYAASDAGLLVFDVSVVATQPSLVGFYPTTDVALEAGLAGQPYIPPTGPVTDVALSASGDDRAWIAMDGAQAGWSTVIELDVSNPWAPVYVAEHGIPGDDPTLDHRVFGERHVLYVGYLNDCSSGVKIFDVTTPGALTYKNAFGTGLCAAMDVASSAGVTDTVFATGANTLKALNTQVLEAPYLSGYQALGAERVCAGGDLVVTSDPDDAVRIYRFTGETSRKFGLSRYDTAVSMSKDFASAEYVVIATGRTFPDALAAAPLAHALGAPILLVNQTYIPDSVKAEITRLGATKAVIVGGTKAVADSVVDELVVLGIPEADIERIDGADRYETSKEIALKLQAVLGGGDITVAFCASGANFPDALAAGGAAAKLGLPILLVKPGELPDATEQALNDLNVADTLVLGGTGAVGGWADTELPSPARLAGASRYDTAKEVADWALDPTNGTGFTADEVFVATGRNFPDALPCGVVAARHDGVTLLVGTSLPTATGTFVSDNASDIDVVHVVGGAGAVPLEVEWDIAGLLR